MAILVTGGADSMTDVKGLTGSFQLMKSLNKSLILNTIRLHSPISRADIAKKTSLTPPTVTNIVGELLESQLVVESDLGSSTGGRKPILLRIHSSAFQVIGVDVGGGHIKVIAVNLNGEVLESIGMKVREPVTESTLLEQLKHSVYQIMERAQLKKETILGIGVGMHGLVNSDEGITIYAPNFNLHRIPIREFLEKEFDLPVEVENDVRAMALGESWFGHGIGVEDFICLNVGMGIGAGIIIGNKLFKGKSHTAGEIGHTTIQADGPRCSCGNAGCLQAMAAGPALASQARQALEAGRESSIIDLIGGDLSQVTGEVIHQAAREGDPLAKEMLAQTGRYLGIGVANLINLLNPSKVIIGGGVSKAGDFLLHSLQKEVTARSLAIPTEAVEITTTKLGDQATAVGAATLVLNRLFLPEFGFQ